MSGRKLTWTVELSVDESWVADGFILTDERAHEMLSSDLSYAYGHELKARIIKAPSPVAIAKLQGYRTVADMLGRKLRVNKRGVIQHRRSY